MHPETPSKSSESDIIAAAASGDLSAFDALLGLYEKAVFNYVHRMLGHRQDAEDVMQNAFIKAYSHLRSFDRTKKFSTWLFAIATNAAYDFLRKKRRTPVDLIIDDEENDFETIDPDQAYINIDDHAQLETALAEIRPEYRSALLLFYIQEFTYEEIADQLSLPINTVKTHLRRGKEALRQALTRL